MSRNDLDNIILRPGELHVTMAILRCIGSYIEASVIDSVWIESDIYGSSTVKQILEGRHVKRGVYAHITTLQALFSLYTEAFFQENQILHQKYKELAIQLNAACEAMNEVAIQEVNNDLASMIEEDDLLNRMQEFYNNMTSRPLYIFVRNYMQMILEMTMYIRSVRTGDWNMHIKSTELLVKYFFAHDKQNYARLLPIYLADMKALERSDPDIWTEFMNGNWVVNKSRIPFCAIRADHALEQVNRSMKVSGGLIGITLKPMLEPNSF